LRKTRFAKPISLPEEEDAREIFMLQVKMNAAIKKTTTIRKTVINKNRTKKKRNEIPKAKKKKEKRCNLLE